MTAEELRTQARARVADVGLDFTGLDLYRASDRSVAQTSCQRIQEACLLLDEADRKDLKAADEAIPRGLRRAKQRRREAA